MPVSVLMSACASHEELAVAWVTLPDLVVFQVLQGKVV